MRTHTHTHTHIYIDVRAYITVYFNDGFFDNFAEVFL